MAGLTYDMGRYWTRYAYLVPNELNRCSLGDRSDLNYAPDGSLTLYLQKDNPGVDKDAN
jgi:hypothetical protein